MPNRDGTGPCGEGRLTGRRLGPCVESEDRVLPLRRGMGRGIGRGR